MTNNPRSHNLEEILAGYVLGDLDETELLWLQEQMAAQPELQERITQLEHTLNLLPYSLPEESPQGDLRQQILAQVRPRSISEPALPQSRSLKSKSGWIVGAITLVSTFILGINNFSLRQQIALTEDQLLQQQELIALLRQPNNRLVALTASNAARDATEHEVVAASGSLVLAPESGRAVLALKNLTPLPGNQVYRLWAVSQGKKTGCSNFKPDAKGEVHLNLTLGEALGDANSVLITIEPRPDTEQPLGQEFLTDFYQAI